MTMRLFKHAFIAALVLVPGAGWSKTKNHRDPQSFVQAMDQCRKNNGGATTVMVTKGKSGWVCASSMAGMNGGK
jgi:hypothetical protein